MVWKSEIGPQTAELHQFGKIQKIDNFRGSKSEKNIFLIFFKITESSFYLFAIVPHDFWVFVPKITIWGLTQVQI